MCHWFVFLVLWTESGLLGTKKKTKNLNKEKQERKKSIKRKFIEKSESVLSVFSSAAEHYNWSGERIEANKKSTENLTGD